MKTLLIVALSLVVTGCNYESYRYPCQDPANWGNEECQKPQCEVSRTCPEHIFKKGKSNVQTDIPQPKPVAQVSPKTECK